MLSSAALPVVQVSTIPIPSSSHLPLQMRESPGYAPVLSDAVPVAGIADAAASRGRRRRPRRLDEWAPSAGG